ncbi:MAG: Stp1/IreP family PP2C-type Ser/Thr phosphatase [Gaiellales bacterium]|nr:MAG: Stp1/IreP family PP2C-type Ser/Thr phosphatase [Gaiellales bacterium]
MPATFATESHTGLVRRGNEDAALAQPPVFAVADGMGGALAGEVASGMAVAALAEAAPGTPEELASAIREVNGSIFAQATGDAGRSGMGTTLTAALAGEGSVTFVHVGDSRAYRLRGGLLEQLSSDHSLVAEMVRRGELSEEDALAHPQRSIITRALGVDADVELDSFSVELAPGDMFLLCSDGLYSMVPEPAVEKILNGSGDLAVAARSLVEAALAGGGEDNVTVVLFCPDGAVPSGDGQGPGAAERGSSPPAGGTAEGGPGERAVRNAGRWRDWRVLAAVALALVIILTMATWYMTRQVYYLGASEGRVSIFQGLPLEVGPVSLSSLYRQSDVSLDDLEPFERERVLREELTSLEAAEEMLQNYSGRQGAEAGTDREDAGRRPSATTATGTGF